VPSDELVAYDREHFPSRRPDFLRCWVASPGTTSLGCERGGRLVGYGVIRPAYEGHKVGPLFANEPGVADAFVGSLLATAPGQSVFNNAPDQSANPHVTEFVRRYGLSESFRTARMYNKAIPRLIAVIHESKTFHEQFFRSSTRRRPSPIGSGRRDVRTC
jgi:hypothetical protein